MVAKTGLGSMQKTITSIAVFRALYLGDLLCSVPLLRVLRDGYPQAKITLIGLPWQIDFVKRFSKYVDHFIQFPGWPGLPEQQVSTEQVLNFLKDVRGQHFDLLLQLHDNGEMANSICMLWGAKTICGLCKAGEFCPDELLFPIAEDDEHEILRLLKLSDALNLSRKGTHLEFPLLDGELVQYRHMARALNLTDGNYVCVHAGARDARKRWSVENFAFVADHISSLGHTVVLTGSLDEKPILESIQREMRCPVINLIERFGHVSLGELAAFIAHSKMLFCNDTSVSQIAAALQIPSVIIFSPFSNIKRRAPLDSSLHLSLPSGKANDAEYVLYCLLDHLSKQETRKESTVFS
jgi:ADP-heptose:LPS heptosyltransferase